MVVLLGAIVVLSRLRGKGYDWADKIHPWLAPGVVAVIVTAGVSRALHGFIATHRGKVVSHGVCQISVPGTALLSLQVPRGLSRGRLVLDLSRSVDLFDGRVNLTLHRTGVDAVAVTSSEFWGPEPTFRLKSPNWLKHLNVTDAGRAVEGYIRRAGERFIPVVVRFVHVLDQGDRLDIEIRLAFSTCGRYFGVGGEAPCLVVMDVQLRDA